MAIKFRDAKLDDKERDQIVTLMKYAYDEPPLALEHIKKWWNVIYKEHYVGAEKWEVLASLRCLPFLQNIRGVFKKSAGIGMVATYPEERRKGYCRGLLKYTYEKMK
ncbi:MAG: GNAT family N-acetyltransferase, partial [Promethearchaeota archaeon]